MCIIETILTTVLFDVVDVFMTMRKFFTHAMFWMVLLNKKSKKRDQGKVKSSVSSGTANGFIVSFANNKRQNERDELVC